MGAVTIRQLLSPIAGMPGEIDWLAGPNDRLAVIALANPLTPEAGPFGPAWLTLPTGARRSPFAR